MSNDNRNFTTGFTVAQSPEAVTSAIANVRAWWSAGITGSADKVGDTFTHNILGLHRCDLVVREIVPGKKMVWHVLDNHFSFTKDKTEWKGNDIVFDIVSKDGQTELTFTQIGLVPEYECYQACFDGWTTYVRSLHDLIASGQGNPNLNTAITASEKALTAQAQAAA